VSQATGDLRADRETYPAFAHGEAFADARRRRGLPDPVALDDFLVRATVVDGRPRR